MNTAANEEYWNKPDRDRRRSRERRAEDLHTCAFHDSTCERVEELMKDLKSKVSNTMVSWLIVIMIASFSGLGWMISDMKGEIKSVAHEVKELRIAVGK